MILRYHCSSQGITPSKEGNFCVIDDVFPLVDAVKLADNLVLAILLGYFEGKTDPALLALDAKLRDIRERNILS